MVLSGHLKPQTVAKQTGILEVEDRSANEIRRSSKRDFSRIFRIGKDFFPLSEENAFQLRQQSATVSAPANQIRLFRLFRLLRLFRVESRILE